MTDYQVTSWRDLPSLVVVRDGDSTTKTPLAPRFQEADNIIVEFIQLDRLPQWRAPWKKRPSQSSSEDADIVSPVHIGFRHLPSVGHRPVSRRKRAWRHGAC